MNDVEVIIEAVDEARILECGRDSYDHFHMLAVAAKLCQVPLPIVEATYAEILATEYQLKVAV